jgi:hypothetical protein
VPLIDYQSRIADAYCPMGCGETLCLLNSGYVHCMAGECPQPDAARKILSNPEHLDVVLIGADSWTVLHPVRERLGDLFTCPVITACQQQLGGPPDGVTGYFRAQLDEAGKLCLEHLPGGYSVIPGSQ